MYSLIFNLNLKEKKKPRNMTNDLKWITLVKKATKVAKALIVQNNKSFRYYDA
jgi:hypothetical protein